MMLHFSFFCLLVLFENMDIPATNSLKSIVPPWSRSITSKSLPAKGFSATAGIANSSCLSMTPFPSLSIRRK